MRIGFCGTQSTGKSTLVNELLEDEFFKDYYIDVNVTRKKILELGLPINKETNDLSQEMNLTIRGYNLFCYNKIISDRTLMDVLAYSELSDNVSSESYAKQLHEAGRIASLYDYVFFLPPTIKLDVDSVRSPDEDYRIKVSDQILLHCDLLKVDYDIIDGTISERVEQVMDIVKNASRNR